MKIRRLVALPFALVALAASGTADADTVTDWNANASDALFTVAGQPPPVGVLHMAMVQGAVFDAVNAIDGRYQPYLYSPSRPRPWASRDVAAATAAYRVLVSIVPAQKPALEPLYHASLIGTSNLLGTFEGVAIGEAAAAAMIAARTNDGRFGACCFPTGTLPGQWRPTPPAFVNDPNGWVRNVKPFAIQSSSQFRSAGPWPLTSGEYAAEFNQVKEIGSLNSTTRTAAQTNAALYWAEAPARTWNRIVRTLSAQEGLTLVENARLFAMVNMAAADTLINVWDDKAFWGFWRPITAIREANLDGNPATTADPGWLPLVPTPPYPEHAAGLPSVGAAFSRTLQHFFGTNDLGWSDTNVGGRTRSFAHLSDAADEIVNARVWSGIHFLRADVHGALIGTQVADWVAANEFRQLP